MSNPQTDNLPHAVRLTWDAPFTLDITSVDPDIWYHVDIRVNGTSNIIASNCSNVPEFIYNGTDASAIYEFRVTPINGAGNGTTSAPVTGYFRGGELSVRRIGVESYPWSALPIHLLATFALSQ